MRAVPDIVEIPLPSGHVAIIDADDWPLVSGYKWYAEVNLRRGPEAPVYVKGHPPGMHRHTRLHRLLLSAQPGQEVDHKNHDGLDNRRANLRLCTPSLNAAHRRRRSDNTSGYKGVDWSKTAHKWRVRVQAKHDSKQRRHVGYFDDPWEAAQAYNAAALEQWGEYALLNVRHETEESEGLAA